MKAPSVNRPQIVVERVTMMTSFRVLLHDAPPYGSPAMTRR